MSSWSSFEAESKNPARELSSARWPPEPMSLMPASRASSLLD